ncbi:hypothetical protein ABBQ32_007495 [Trebouxia sp. C0010 RCD-2024]
MPPSIITHAAFKTIMAAQIQAFMLACPVSPTAGRAVRWDQLKVHIQDVARNYCSTFHADCTKQLRALRVRAGLAEAAYLADPTSQPALDQLRHTAADLQQHRQQQAATQALRAGVLLHEYGDQSTYYFHHLHRQRQQATVIANLQQQPGSPQVDLCTESGRQQADSIIVSFFSADSPTGMFKQLPTDVPAQQALLSSVNRQLPAWSRTQRLSDAKVSQSRRRRRSDRRFFEALEGCAGNAGLGPRPQYYFSVESRSALVVTFGHLYPDKASKAAQQDVEASVMVAIREKYTSQLVAIDPQRLGTATAAYDLHFTEQFLQLKQSLRDKGELPIDFNGQQKFVRTSEKNSKSSPMFAQIVVKQLDLRWRVQGATSALLRAAGYEGEVAVKTEFAGELPAHLSFWGGGALGRSDTIVAQVTAPATDPSLRKLPRSIQLQGHIVSISVLRSLHSKTEQRNSRDSETLLKQQRRRAKQARRKVRRRRRALPPARDAADIDVTVAKGALELVASDVQVGSGEASTFWS